MDSGPGTPGPVERRTRSFSLRARLFALVLVPALLGAALVGVVASSKRQAATVASSVDAQVGDLAGLVDLRAALLFARSGIEIQVRAASVGIAPEQALTMLQLDPGNIGDLSEARASLRRLPARLRPFGASQLEQLEAATARGASLAVLDRFGRLDLLVEEAWNRRLDDLGERVVELGDVALARDLQALEDASSAGSATASLLTGLADYWFSEPGSARSEAARSALGQHAARFQQAVGALRSHDDPVVARAARTIAEARDDGPFGIAIRDAVAGRPAAPFADGVDLSIIVATFADSFDQLEPLVSLVGGRSAALERRAEALADVSARTANLALLATALVLLAVVGLAWGVSSSLARPLRRLIDTANQVGAGDLSADLLPIEGPAEVAAASAAFNDVIVNLQMLKGKMDALAAADLDDQRLETELPGDLGAALEASVEVLAGSVADRAALQDRLAHQATHDPLTGIANRAGALGALDAALARAQRGHTPVAVAFLDLDGFKAINDRHGHAAGDQVLREVANRLVATARAGDLCARIGGDEFIVVAERTITHQTAPALGNRICRAIERPIAIDGGTVEVGASVGIVVTDHATEAPLELVHRADVAAYRAKRAGTDVEVFRALGVEQDDDPIPPAPSAPAAPSAPPGPQARR